MMGQSLLRFVLGGDVLYLDHEQVRLAVPTGYHYCDPTRPDTGAVGPHQTQHLALSFVRPGKDASATHEGIFEVVGVDDVVQPVCQEPGLVISEQVTQCAVDDHEA